MLRGVGRLPEGVVQVERRLLPCHVHHDDVVVGQLIANRAGISREEILRARRQLLAWLGVGSGVGVGLWQGAGVGVEFALGLGLGLALGLGLG